MHYRRWKTHSDPTVVVTGKVLTTCIVEGCERPARAREYCTKHYQRWKAHGNPTVIATKPAVVIRTWQQPQGCSDSARNGTSPYCEKHYSRMKRHGDPLVALKDHTPPHERWNTSYDVDPDWLLELDGSGEQRVWVYSDEGARSATRRTASFMNR